MTNEELERAVRESESNGNPLPADIEQQRLDALEAAKQPVAAVRGLVCCRVVVNGSVQYHKVEKNGCTGFPLYGTVVADSNCK